ncbi:hypothetical protein E2320_019797 [Naja naja]|nr:hypothetical protein E2320_019797 [Naja naja]
MLKLPEKPKKKSEPSKSSTKSTVDTTLPSLQNNNEEYLETPKQTSRELRISAYVPDGQAWRSFELKLCFINL